MATKAEIVKAVKLLERADIEYRRALAAWSAVRVSKAGTALEVAKAKLFNLVKS